MAVPGILTLSQAYYSWPIFDLVASDCFEIGRYAYQKGDKYHALMWLLEALAIYEIEGEPTMNLVLLLDFLTYSASDVSFTQAALITVWLLITTPQTPHSQISQ